MPMVKVFPRQCNWSSLQDFEEGSDGGVYINTDHVLVAHPTLPMSKSKFGDWDWWYIFLRQRITGGELLRILVIVKPGHNWDGTPLQEQPAPPTEPGDADVLGRSKSSAIESVINNAVTSSRLDLLHELETLLMRNGARLHAPPRGMETALDRMLIWVVSRRAEETAKQLSLIPNTKAK